MNTERILENLRALPHAPNAGLDAMQSGQATALDFDQLDKALADRAVDPDKRVSSIRVDSWKIGCLTLKIQACYGSRICFA